MKNKKLLILAISILLVAGLFFYLNPKENSETPTSADKPQEQKTQVKTFNLKITEKKLEEENTFQVKQDEEVLFKIESNKAEKFHLHGYDISVELEPGKIAELKLKADKTGRFVIELENSETDIGALEVNPK